MPGGRPKKPADVQLKKGNPGKRKLAGLKAAAQALTVEDCRPQDGRTTETSRPLIEPPAYLTTSAERRIWDAVTPYLVARGVLKSTDTFVLARWCSNAALWLEMRSALRDERTKSGIRLIETHRRKTGTVTRIRHEFTIQRMLATDMRADEAALGLSPSSRASLATRLANLSDRPIPIGEQGEPSNQPPNPIGLLASKKLN